MREWKLVSDLNDFYDTLLSLVASEQSTPNILVKLHALYSVIDDPDNEQTINFSTVHRAKGLQADSVYILDIDLFFEKFGYLAFLIVFFLSISSFNLFNH